MMHPDNPNEVMVINGKVVPRTGPTWGIVGPYGTRHGNYYPTHGLGPVARMDFVMDLRWSYCLRNGLPLDTDVYDMASWSCLCDITERSVNARSAAIDIPDFTRGAWRTTKPFAPETFDPAKLGLEKVKGIQVGEQQNV